MKKPVTVPLKILIPDHCYECPFWDQETSEESSMSVCFFPQIPEWGRVRYEVLGPDDPVVPSCPLRKLIKEENNG